MKFYQVFEDDNNYMTVYFDPDEVEDKRGDDDFTIFTTPQAYASDWVPLELSIKACDSPPVIPAISTWLNYLVLHESAYKALEGMLGPYGEFLPCTYQGAKFYLFNPLTIAEDLDAVMPGSVTKDDGLLASIAFDEEKLKDTPVFRTKESYICIYCTEAFKNLVEKEKLEGLRFSAKLAHV
ncbi:hypothetical protein MO867_20265 [Microbulbifer sp. OS29]|uniref:Immunity MXAN-0049 protein domain-containing protein n=1 Tax=Microbulbifer okhotskensis TaxID=2926617 RepID=A0A9X2EQM5_9GAMM|nr:DUF1629 domain-containing protein [Microbulbifer okhotskensis]MCO1336664.1 hypothetical protein [Microbulbifer okhotskensis]